MLKKTLSVLLIALLLASAFAESYTAADFPVFREALTGEAVTLRFYDDMPNVPCLGLKAFYRLMLGEALAVEALGGERYRFTTPGGATALADAGAGTVTCDDYPAFFNLMGAVVPGMDDQYLDAPAFAVPGGLVYDAPEPVTFDLASYHIPMHGGDGDVFLPLATLSDLFTNLAYIYMSFNGEKVYVNFDNRLAPAWQRDPDYAKPIYRRAQRPADLAAFSYDELCFALDTFYGYPGRAPLNDALAEWGLDGALDRFSDYSRRCKALLQSEKLGEYALGSQMLSTLLDDGGHTGLDFAALYTDDPDFYDFATDYYLAANESPLDRSAYAGYVNDARLKKRMQQKRRDAYGSDHYVERGDTAVIWFDTFMYDFDGWQAYYEGGGPRPVRDAMAYVVDGLDRASQNPEIQNVVLDVSCNPGGSADMVMAVMSLIADASSFPTENRLVGRATLHTYRVDRNFDGRFDDADSAIHYDFNYGVLASHLTFSCGNLLTSLMKDRGFAVLGDTSGGGTCAVEMHAAPEGFAYQFSSGLGRFVNKDGDPVDEGVPADIPLSEEEYYDIGALSRAMNTFYG